MEKLITKIVKSSLFLLTFLFFIQSTNAQAPEKMSYQAVVRDASNNLIANSVIGIQILILRGAPNGTIMFAERQTPMTNANGLASIEIGSGVPITGNLSSIDWGSDSYFIKTDIDPIGGSNYTVFGVSQLSSVPYSFYAQTSGDNLWSYDGFGNITNKNNISTTIQSSGNNPLKIKGSSGSLTRVYEADIVRGEFGGTSTGDGFGYGSVNGKTFLTTSNGFVTTKQLTVDTNGNVGIGIDPTEKLEIAGKTKTSNLQITSGAGINKILTSDASGNATWQTPLNNNLNTGFDVTTYANQVIPNSSAKQIIFDSENTDNSNAFNPTTSEWLVPSSGFYHVDLSIGFFTLLPANSKVTLMLYKNGSVFKSHPQSITGQSDMSFSCSMTLIAGDIITAYIIQSSGSNATLNNGFNYTYMSGFKVY